MHDPRHHLLFLAKLALTAGAILASSRSVNGPKIPVHPPNEMFRHLAARPVIVTGAR